MNKLSYLSQINLLEELPVEDLRMIDAMAPMMAVEKGTLVISPHMETRRLYFLKQGRVRLYTVNEAGKQLTIGLLGEGSIFGETETFTVGAGFLYVEALENAMVCVIAKEDFEMLLMKRPQLALRLISLLSQRLRESEEMLQNLAFQDVRHRLLYLLAKLVRNFGLKDSRAVPIHSGPHAKIDVNLTHQELADMIGSTRESVSAALSQLAKEGLVTMGRKEIAVDLGKAGEMLGDP